MENTEIKVLLDKNERQDEKLQNIVNQLDKDRNDLDRVLITMKDLDQTVKALMSQMTDFKSEMRQLTEDTVTSTIKRELPQQVKKAVDNKWRLVNQRNPNKAVERTQTFPEWIKSLLFKNKK